MDVKEENGKEMPVLSSVEIYPSKTTIPSHSFLFLLSALLPPFHAPLLFNICTLSACFSPHLFSHPISLAPLFFIWFSEGPRWRIKMSERSNANIHHWRALRAYTQKATQRLTCLARVINTESTAKQLGTVCDSSQKFQLLGLKYLKNLFRNKKNPQRHLLMHAVCTAALLHSLWI